VRRAINAVRLSAAAVLARTPDSAAIEKLRDAKLAALLKHARATVPFYRDLFDERGISAGQLRDPDVLESLPVLTKAQLQQAGEKLLSDRYPAERRTFELTSGSSGQPFATHFDREYVIAKNLRFLRALLTCGYRPGKKLMLITERPTTRMSALRRWLYCPLDAPPEEHATRLSGFQPAYLYGCMTPLRLLAQHLSDTGAPFTPPRAVISTAEMLDPGTRALLERVFRAPVLDFYGMTEMGLVAWQAGAGAPYNVATDGILIERIAVPSAPGWYRLVMTNLDLWAMPMIRYDTGDTGAYGGAHGHDLLRIEGRSVDCIVGPEQRLISPFQLTSALQDVDGLRRFRIRQTRPDEIEVDLETDAAASVKGETIARLTPLLGASFRIKPQIVGELGTGPGGKFRVVESLSQRALASKG
jgi:phenylacetate-CoA ligase